MLKTNMLVQIYQYIQHLIYYYKNNNYFDFWLYILIFIYSIINQQV